MGLYYTIGKSMKKVILRAPLLSFSGYGTHARQIFRYLLSKKSISLNVGIVPWGITSWMVNPDLEDGLIGEIMSRSVPAPEDGYDVSVQLQLPNEWSTDLAKVNVGMSAVVETDRCNPQWVEACNKMDHIIVPSTHTQKCLENTGYIHREINVVPESIYDQISSKDLEGLDLDINTDFNFLVFGQLTGNTAENDRKNLFNTIKWLCEEFKDDPDVGIILKTNSGRNTKIDKQITLKTFEQVVKDVRTGEYPKFHLLHGTFSQLEIARLYRNPKIKALVSMTRGEGYGLPLLEASCSGLPVITTNWSGHLDFMRKGKFVGVDYDMVDIPSSRVDGSIFIQGAWWADPKEEDAKRRFRKFYEQSQAPKDWATSLRQTLLPLYNQDAVNAIYEDVLGKYLE